MILFSTAACAAFSLVSNVVRTASIFVSFYGCCYSVIFIPCDLCCFVFFVRFIVVFLYLCHTLLFNLGLISKFSLLVPFAIVSTMVHHLPNIVVDFELL